MRIIFAYSVAFLLPILEAWKKECKDNSFGILGSVAELAKHLQLMIESPSCKVLVMIDGMDNPVGFMGLTILKNPIGVGEIASEHLWYILPAFRGRGLNLLNTAKNWAKVQGCTHFMATASKLASDLHDSTCKIYSRLGMKQIETTYICSLEG